MKEVEATTRQLARLHFLGMKTAKRMSMRHAAELLEHTAADPQYAEAIVRWRTEKYLLYPDMFARFAEIYVIADAAAEVTGPFTLVEVCARAADGRLDPAAALWACDGSDSWHPVAGLSLERPEKTRGMFA